MRILVLILAAGLAGCGFGRPALMVEINGRKLEFESFQGGKIPLGSEVSYFDSKTLRVQGDQPIEVNGMAVLARGNELTIGGRKFMVDREAKILVSKQGEIQVSLNTKPSASDPVKSVEIYGPEQMNSSGEDRQ